MYNAMYSGELKVNGKTVPLNEQMKKTLFNTLEGFSRSLRGVEGDIQRLEIVMKKE